MTDAEIVSLHAEYRDLIERAARLERDASNLIQTAGTYNREAQQLRTRAKAVLTQLDITCT